LKHIEEERIKNTVSSSKLNATSDFSKLKEVDAIIICVPTPLTNHREPDMSFVVSTGKTDGKFKVYNVLGEIVRNLINEEREAGNYSVTFDGTGLPSGIYIYRLETANYIANRKMSVLK